MTEKSEPKTRSAILNLLKKGGEMSAASLAKEVNLTPMAVRLQLYDLQEEGLVTERSEAKGRGRPQKLWSLTEAAARVFPDAHQGLALGLIQSVEAAFGENGLQAIIAKHGEAQRKAYGERLANANTIGEKVQALATIRSEEGYMAEALEEGVDWLLIENHCPICSAAKACTRLCTNELEVFQSVLGNNVTIAREEHIIQGARRCAYRVVAI